MIKNRSLRDAIQVVNTYPVSIELGHNLYKRGEKVLHNRGPLPFKKHEAMHPHQNRPTTISFRIKSEFTHTNVNRLMTRTGYVAWKISEEFRIQNRCGYTRYSGDQLQLNPVLVKYRLHLNVLRNIFRKRIIRSNILNYSI